MQERDIKRAFEGILPDNELKEKVLEAIDRHEPRKFNWDFSRIVPVALCAVVLVNGFLLYKSLPEKNNSVIPLDLSSADISNSKVVDIKTTSIPVTETSSEIVVKKNLNLELLSEIGLTYSQIQEKYGEPVSVYYSGGVYWYKFENGFENGCDYFWHETDVIYEEGKTRQFKVNGEMELTKEGTPQPKADVGCVYISGFKTQDLFLDLKEYIDTSEIEKTYGIKYKDNFFTPHWYGAISAVSQVSTFAYNDIIIQVGTTEGGIILSDFDVSIYHNEWEDKRTVTETAETVAETTQTQEETTDITETTPETVSNENLNLDLLSEIGLTYSQLKEKYGKPKTIYYDEGLIWYQFENSSCTYGWNGMWDFGYSGEYVQCDEKRKRYEITNENAQQPKAEVGCKGINDINYKDMFLGISESISFSELEETYGIQGIGTYVVADYERKKGWEAYLQTFNYNSMTVYIYTKAIGKIDSETYVAFFYR